MDLRKKQSKFTKIRQLFNNSSPASLVVTCMLMFALFFIAHINLTYYGDDYYFRDLLEQNGFLETLSIRWKTWTSRLIIESILLLVAPNIWIWKIINSFTLVLLVIAISKIIFVDLTVGKLTITFLIVHLYPFYDMYSAGWVSTTVNYLWPLTLMTIAFIPLQKLIIGNSNIQKKNLFLYTICAIISTNNEQVASITLIVGFISFAYIYFVKKTKNYYPLLLCIIGLISVLIISICPGNQARIATAILIYSPNWNLMHFYDKMFIAIQITSAVLLKNTYILVIALSLLFTIGLYRNKITIDSILIFSLFAILLLIRFICNIRGTIILPLFAYQPSETNLYYPLVTSILLFLLHFTVLFSFPFLVWRIIGNNTLPIIIIIGIASRLLAGLSPTFIDSGDRTMIFYYFTLISSILYLSSHLYYEFVKNDHKSSFFFFNKSSK